jgi:hypothetical protein
MGFFLVVYFPTSFLLYQRASSSFAVSNQMKSIASTETLPSGLSFAGGLPIGPVAVFVLKKRVICLYGAKSLTELCKFGGVMCRFFFVVVVVILKVCDRI